MHYSHPLLKEPSGNDFCLVLGGFHTSTCGVYLMSVDLDNEHCFLNSGAHPRTVPESAKKEVLGYGSCEPGSEVQK